MDDQLPELKCHRCWLRHSAVKQIPSEEGDRFVCVDRKMCRVREEYRKKLRSK